MGEMDKISNGLRMRWIGSLRGSQTPTTGLPVASGFVVVLCSLVYWVRILVPTPLSGSTVKPAIRMQLFALEEYAHPAPSKLVRKNKTTSGTVIFVWVSWQPLSDLQARLKTQSREFSMIYKTTLHSCLLHAWAISSSNLV